MEIECPHCDDTFNAMEFLDEYVKENFQRLDWTDILKKYHPDSLDEIGATFLDHAYKHLDNSFNRCKPCDGTGMIEIRE